MRTFACLVISFVALPTSARGSVQVYFNGLDHSAARASWMSGAANFTTIPFTGFANHTIITTQYSAQGIIFTDGTDRITLLPNFANDGAGLRGVLDEIHLSFTQPTHTIATDFLDNLRIQLYLDDQLVYTSPDFFALGGLGFAGLISDTPFDAAIISDPTGNVNIDDLFFGPPISAPATLGLLAMAVPFNPTRRRRP